MKKISSIICLFLSLIMLFSASVGCGNNQNDDSGSHDSDGTFDGVDIGDNSSIEKYDDSKYLVSKQKSDYAIVVEKDSDVYSLTAAAELSDFIYESSGCRLAVVTDETLTYKNTDKYISIGNTRIFQQSGLTLDSDLLGLRGCKIYSDGNLIFLNGTGDYGKLNSVYKFLNIIIGFEAFAIDEVYYAHKDTIELYKFDVNYKFATGGGAMSSAGMLGASNAKLMARMFLMSTGQAGASLNGQFFGSGYYLNTVKIMKDDYGDLYPEWFQTSDQLCLTNEECIRAYADFVYNKQVLSDPRATYFVFANTDNSATCNCEKCAEERRKSSAGGAMLKFINAVDDIIQANLKRDGIDRKVVLVGLAYLGYDKAPAKYNATTGKYEPISNEYKCHTTTGIMYAPISACYSHALNDEHCEYNKNLYANILGWKACAGDNFTWYLYGTNYSNYFLIFNDFNSTAANAKIFEETDTLHVYYQGNSHNVESPLLAYRLYIKSKLWENPDYDVEVLTKKFFKQYYKEIWEECYGFYDAMRNNYILASKIKGAEDCFIYATKIDWMESKYWPLSLLLNWYTEYFEPAKRILEIKYQGEEYEKMSLRLLALEIYVRYLILSNYKSYYADYDKEYAQFIEDCKKLGITKATEVGGFLY